MTQTKHCQPKLILEKDWKTIENFWGALSVLEKSKQEIFSGYFRSGNSMISCFHLFQLLTLVWKKEKWERGWGFYPVCGCFLYVCDYCLAEWNQSLKAPSDSREEDDEWPSSIQKSTRSGGVIIIIKSVESSRPSIW